MIHQPWAHRRLAGPAGLILLDRDGVLVDLADRYVVRRGDVESIPGVATAVTRLAAGGYRAAVVTNQSAIGRGLVSQRDVLRINRWIMGTVDPRRVFIQCSLICPHSPTQQCRCRKPETAGIRSFEAIVGPFDGGWFVGDQLSDMRAADTLRMRAALVLTGHGQGTAAQIGLLQRTPLIVDSLTEFADHLLSPLFTRTERTSAPG